MNEMNVLKNGMKINRNREEGTRSKKREECTNSRTKRRKITNNNK